MTAMNVNHPFVPIEQMVPETGNDDDDVCIIICICVYLYSTFSSPQICCYIAWYGVP